MSTPPLTTCEVCGETFRALEPITGLSRLFCWTCRHATAEEVLARNRNAPWMVTGADHHKPKP